MEKRPGTDNNETDFKRQKMTEEENKQESFSTVGNAVNQLGTEKSGKADTEGHPVQEIESLCMNCQDNGTTRLLMTRIPYFREVIIMSFFCPHCGFKNSEIQPAGVIQDKGSKHVLQLDDTKDLNRQVVKSETATCKFAELDIEIPPKKGQLTTVEGLLSQIHDDLSSDQPVRMHVDPEGYEKIQSFLKKVGDARDGKLLPLTFTVDDPTGNSWIEFVPGEPSHKWSHVDYFRTKQQNVALGISQEQVEEAAQSGRQIQTINTNRNASTAEKIQQEASEIENFHGEVQTFTASCPSCSSPDCQTNMKPVNIPHFKEVLIFSTVCHACGYKSNEVKTGGAIPEKGRRVTLKVDDPDDLSRDILKSESCGMHIPELNLDLTPGTLGGRFTTLEGILRQVHEELHGKVFSEQHDSMDATSKNNWNNFLARLQSAFEGNMQFTVIMEDPLAASYIQNVFAPDPDPNMTIEDYDRTNEQNEDLGLNDMNA